MVENAAKPLSALPTSINRLSLLFLAVLVFCATTVDSPESTLLAANAALKVPYLDSEIRVSSFLLLGPIAMIAMVIYLHVLIERFDELPDDRRNTEQFLWLTMKSPVMIVARSFLYYYATPCIFILFAWKAMPRPEYGYLAILSISGMAGAVLMQMWRATGRRRKNYFTGVWLAVTIGAIWLVTVKGLMISNYLLHERKIDLMRVDLAASDLRDVRLINSHLEGAILKRANLQRADLSLANLTTADLDDANLRAANLRNTTLTGASLQNALLQPQKVNGVSTPADLRYAKIRNANLTNAQMQWVELAEAEFIDSVLTGANLMHARMSPGTVISRSNLEGAYLIKADMTNIVMENSNLTGAILIGARLDNASLSHSTFIESQLTKASLRGASLDHADLSRALIINATLANADLRDARLTGAILLSTVMNDADLTGANLDGAQMSRTILRAAIMDNTSVVKAFLVEANLAGARLRKSDLTSSDFKDADLSGADLSGATLRDTGFAGADLKGANLTDVKDLTCDQLRAAKNWKTTKRSGPLTTC
ncbi:MAG: hypothetical protein ACI9JL_003948 [Paracoccaceae bacterium]|jgi:uncharacterized protein YjbI with pentapeptide repeats